MLHALWNGLPYYSKKERAVAPRREDWVLIALKFAAMRLISAIEETEKSLKHRAHEEKHSRLNAIR